MEIVIFIIKAMILIFLGTLAIGVPLFLALGILSKISDLFY